MRIAVTGAAGFVGRYLCEHLASAGHEVIGWGLADTADRRALLADAPGIAAWDHCDVTRAADTARVVRRWAPGAIVHLAAQSSAARSFADPVGTFETNAAGTLHVLEAVRTVRPEARVLLVGSSDMYAQPDVHAPLREDAPVASRNPYGASKIAADALGAQYAATYGLPIVRTRSFMHTGPGQTTAFALPSFAEQIARAESTGESGAVSVGNVDVMRDFLDVRDVVRAYAALLDKGVSGEAYNVCSGTGVRLGDLLDSLVRQATVPITVTQSADRLRPTDLTYMVGDPAKLHAATGWEPSIPLDRCLTDMLNEWRRTIAGEAGLSPRSTKG